MAGRRGRADGEVAAEAGDPLEPYRGKRDFAKTREPSGADGGTDGAAPAALSFCVQKHDAKRLHYDFRIEWDGVLKSWAVTKGPSLDPSDKRLAVRTEDHPLAYGDFEGTIPKGQYGGGSVMLWDRGGWEPREDPVSGFKKGSLKLSLSGEKMTGDWALVRMKRRKGETRENWLLIKEKDGTADSERDLLVHDRSVKTGRSMAQIAAADETLDRGKTDFLERPASEKAAKMRGGRRTTPTRAAPEGGRGLRSGSAGGREPSPPAFVAPQLATLVDEAPDGEGWISEMKYDGYRVLLAVGGDRARLFTRNGKDWTDRLTGIADAALALPCESALIDGEAVAFDAEGRTDFSALQASLADRSPLSCFGFDILALDGEDLRKMPLVERKAILRGLLPDRDGASLIYGEHVEGNGPKVFAHLCEGGHEGIVAKRADAPYRSGRSKSWLKVKCGRRQEFVIGGYAPSDKAGRPFASILVGVFEGERLAYRGRVGSGFAGDAMDDLAARFDGLARTDSPFGGLPRPVARNAKFVAPELIAEIDFAELTADGQVRHGVFKGLRADKAAEEVVGEGSVSATSRPRSGTGVLKRAHGRTRIAGIRITHADRVVFTDHELTKGALAAYYERVAERMLAHAGDRPLSLVRCPDGPTRHCFFQKHASKGFPDAVGSVTLPEKDGGDAEYLSVTDAIGLVGAVQMNALEFHVWGARNDRPERPDRLVFDLDPDMGLGFEVVRRAAFDLRDRLSELGLETFALATGGKGVHVVAPLERRQTWDDLKGFAGGFAKRLSAEQPARFTATMSKDRRKGKIFIDWLRNERGATAIAPYSTRSRKGAAVATPVSWAELEGLRSADSFDPAAVLERIEGEDPWAGYGKRRQSLTQSMLRSV